MKTILVLAALLIGGAAHAEVQTIEVCGMYVQANGHRFILQETPSRDLPIGRYELFASNQHAAEILSTLKRGEFYCVQGGFDREHSFLGISVSAVQEM